MAKTVLITGCSSGIGHRLAVEFHSLGHRVFATARTASTLTSLSLLGIECLSLDVTSPSSITSLQQTISSKTNGTLDILVNNAGRNYTVPATDVALSEIDETFRTNVFGVMLMCQAFAPLLIKSKGLVVQIGSVAGVIPYAFGAVYNASKAALHSYSETLRVELEPFGVGVVVVVTGGVVSNIARTRRTLPEGSVYQAVAEEYESRQTHSQSVGMASEVYARSVVRQVLLVRESRSWWWWGGRDRIWEGGKARLVWWVSTFLPRWVMEVAMTRMFGLGKLRESGDGGGKKNA